VPFLGEIPLFTEYGIFAATKVSPSWIRQSDSAPAQAFPQIVAEAILKQLEKVGGKRSSLSYQRRSWRRLISRADGGRGSSRAVFGIPVGANL